MNHTQFPSLKWLGCKNWLAGTIKTYWEQSECSRFVEPFCGALGVSARLLPEDALMNDNNPYLINYFKHCQKGFSAPSQDWRINTEEAYYEQRKIFNQLVQLGEACTEDGAVLFHYLNRTGYRGFCRFSRNGYNVPYGHYKTVKYPTDFTVSEIVRRWKFLCLDFEDLQVQLGDFLYVDPPYDNAFQGYTKGGFSWSDQVRLVDWLNRVDSKIPIVVSNANTERILELYQNHQFRVEYLNGPRRISPKGDRERKPEVLLFKNFDPRSSGEE